MSKDLKVEAKKAALQKIRKMLHDKGGDDYHKGISAQVVAKDPEGLKEGLEKASELIEESLEGKEEEKDYEKYSKEELIEMLKERD